MGELPTQFPPESSQADAKKWIGRVVIALILGEAIWGVLVSITNYLVFPVLAKIISANSQFFAPTRPGDVNVQGLLSSVMALGIAGIVAVFLYSWSQKSGRARSKPVRLARVENTRPVSVVAPGPNPPATPAVDRAVQPDASVNMKSASQAPQAPAQVANPASTKAPKVVHYNIVGQPVDDDE